VVNNTDRKFGHILPISSNEVYGCDHGVTLHEESKLRTVIWQFSGQALTEEERVRLAMVRRFVTDDSALDHLISIDEREAILRRITGLEAGGFPEPSEEWPAVPWPPV
ncbi:MAG: phosphatidylinositol kinase, partial [Actinomycetota bacterium]